MIKLTQAQKVARLEKAARAAKRLENALRAAEPTGCLNSRWIEDITSLHFRLEEAVDFEAARFSWPTPR